MDAGPMSVISQWGVSISRGKVEFHRNYDNFKLIQAQPNYDIVSAVLHATMTFRF